MVIKILLTVSIITISLQCKQDTLSLKNYGVIENFILLDQNSQKNEFYLLKANAYLLFFGYTHCPDYCPITLHKLSKIQNEFPEDKKPLIIFITVDPERDTPEVINEYISKFQGKIIGLTGTKEEILHVAKKLGIYYRIERHGPHLHIEHNTSTFFIDKEYQIRYIYGFNEPEKNLKKIIEIYFKN